jgi:hypothetical protein
MKKVEIFSLVFVCLALLVILASCSKEGAVKQLMADPQMSQMIMQKLWETPETKQQLVKMVMDDPESMNNFRESLVSDSAKAAEMLDMMLAREDLKGMITEKTMSLHQTKK